METRIRIRLTMRENISKKKLREFGYIVGFGFPIIIGWIIPSISGHLFRSWTLWIGFLSLFVGILKPNLLFYPYVAWMKLGYILGWVNSKIILGLVYLLVLLPIALIMKIFGYDPLKEKKNKELSFRENIEGKEVDLEKIF